MSFSEDNGYVPVPIEDLMDIVMENVNTQFSTTYTTETFLGTNFYKYFYALIQRLQENEVRTSEIFLKLQEYFDVTNEEIQRPNTTAPGILDYFLSHGYSASVSEATSSSAGKLFICVDTDEDADNYETEVKPEICALVRDVNVAGVVSQGAESSSITLSNGQSFDFKFELPNRIPVGLRVSTVVSENAEFAVDSQDDRKALVLANVAARYGLGKDFEPQRYYSVVDAPWAATTLLQWTDDVVAGAISGSASWHSEVYSAAYNDLFEFSPTRVVFLES